jgi:hypothetical protein
MAIEGKMGVMDKTTLTKGRTKGKQENQSGTVAARAFERTKGKGRWPKNGFSERGAIERLAAEQAVKIERQFERIFGTIAPVWKNDEDFQQCVQQEYDRRLADRAARKETSAGRQRRLVPR